MLQSVEDYLKSERQWLHDQRVGRARFKLSRASTDDERKFWKQVLKALDKNSFFQRKWA